MSELTLEALNVDENRFTGEGSDLSLLHWLRQAEQAIEQLDPQQLSPQIQPLHAFFLKLLLPSPNPTLPKPGRPIRHLVTRCLVNLHKRVESRTLFDFVQSLVRAISDGGSKGMSAAENVSRVACWYAIGEVIKEHGKNMMSFMAEICTSSQKVLRNTNLSVLLRTQSLVAFSKSLYSAGRALPDALLKDLLKSLRWGLQDKALPVQRATAETFVSLHLYSPVLHLQQTLDIIAPLAYKSLETADHTTRRAQSRMLAHFLAATQTPGSGVVQVDNGRKKPEEDNNGEPTVITSAPEDKSARTLFSVQEMLKYISVPYNRPQSPRKLRNALIDVYSTLFSTLGAEYVEANYAEIVKHIMTEIVTPQKGPSTRYEELATRAVADLLLRDLIGERLLSEPGQVNAIRELISSYLKKWQPTLLPGQPKIDKNVLIIALREIAGLLEQLGNAPAQIIELLAEPVVRLLGHESYSVRLAASYTLRRFCHINPSQLPRLLNVLVSDIQKDLGYLPSPTAPKDLSQRLIGKSLGLSALITVSAARPLYVSHDVPTKVFDMAVSLLKQSSDHEIPRASIEVQVAWNLVVGLMSLGPSFVKIHLPQLLVLWRNALPKPSSKDTSVGERGEAEWSYLLQVRECTLSAVLNFFTHNESLVNIDVARRLATLFTNTLNFVNGFATAYAEALREQATSPNPSTIFTSNPSLVDREATLRRRVLQCFTALGPSSATESTQPALLQAAITVFADPENYSGSNTQAAIAAQAGNFTGVWYAADGYAFGVTSTAGVRDIGEGREEEDGWLNRDKVEVDLETLLSRPVLGSLEHDALSLFSAKPLSTSPSPPPAQTGVIDAGVSLFSILFPHQSQEGQVQSLATLSSHIKSSKLERNPGRKQAVVVNTLLALRRSLEKTEGQGSRAKRHVGSGQVSEMIRSILQQDSIFDPTPSIRSTSAEAIGLLASLASPNHLSNQVQWLVDQVVNNRSPDARAGCALAFSAIYSSVGGLSGGPILKTIVNILMSLATDPHPVVHFYAMKALGRVVDAANLSYEPFVPTTLGMLANIYLLETHDPEGGSLGSVNLRGDLPAYQVICRILHALIGVLGPELQEAGRVKSLVFLLVHEFGEETDEGLAVEAIKCIQQFLMFAPAAIDTPKLVKTFRRHLASPRRPLKVASITALYQIVQRDAILISKIGGNQLVEDLFGLLDDDPSIEGVKRLITSWLSETAAALPSGWIDICQKIMTRTAAQKAAAKRPQQTSAGTGFIDDEGESFAGNSAGSGSNALSSRWRTQLFALHCLHDVVQAVSEGNRPEHFDPVLARRIGANGKHMLWSRVGDLIRMAFSASAAGVMEVRVAGLIVLRDVIEKFASSPDPDFDSSLLLEQHQAPIAAALTPSFSSDSAPQVLSLAVQVCAVFVGSGVVKEVPRMGRILKLLTGALEQCKSGDMLSLGDVEDLSPFAAIMLKISIFTAWAELQIASLRQPYLTAVIDPHRWLLAPFWIGALRDYAQLRTDPEMGGLGGGVDSAAGLGREVLLPYYEQAVPKLVHAVAITFSLQDAFALGAMDGQRFSSPTPPSSLPTIRPEPCTNFYTIYGLAFESLLKTLGDTAQSPLAAAYLKALQSLVKPSLSGTTVFEGQFFDELCTVCYRIAMSEPASVKLEMVGVVRDFAISRKGTGVDDAAQTRRALAVVAFTLRQIVPCKEIKATWHHTDPPSSKTALLRSAFSAYAQIIDCIDISQRADLYAVGLHLFMGLLEDEAVLDLVGGCLGSLKVLVEGLVGAQVPGVGNGEKVVHGVVSACLSNVDDMRSRVNPVANLKIKNNLLAITLILTALPSLIKVSKNLVEATASAVGKNLGAAVERPELGLTAIHCASTLLSASLRPIPSPLGPSSPPSPSSVLQHTTLNLLPFMIGYISETVVAHATKAESAPPLGGVREVVKALVAWGTGLPEEGRQRARGYGVLLPTLCIMLDPPGSASTSGPSQLHGVATGVLLGLAQSSPVAFKEATMAMKEGDRGELEKAVREAIGGGKQGQGQGVGKEKEKKGIELRSFG
ncbi:clathrin-coated vesicle protein [Cryptococcus wingfieldii CBS 7118]|uniref:Clathrin-coated vesicle protein n=1 Tax=Cryptococcus wingfieldii CBS 7118 TaxID=1295528 RepID=A0A1E3IIP0_9TREE|nr:clathrin-coated vesicle protein [Cryptococcus wingfieldii CBS 7118]ODN88477.1 clathrin-coated vesicle protein [Cryptococcus wingfieldii CBS 7118]